MVTLNTQEPRSHSGQDVTIRFEDPPDIDQVRLINQRAFGQPGEALLVDRLRGTDGAVSLVAVARNRVIGHILFTDVRIEGLLGTAVGLGPMAVLPAYQRQGIGSLLVRAGLEVCRTSGPAVVVVLGHPDFYPRFGFVPAVTKDLRCEWSVRPEVFMVMELRPGALESVGGLVRYRPEFSDVSSGLSDTRGS